MRKLAPACDNDEAFSLKPRTFFHDQVPTSVHQLHGALQKVNEERAKAGILNEDEHLLRSYSGSMIASCGLRASPYL